MINSKYDCNLLKTGKKTEKTEEKECKLNVLGKCGIILIAFAALALAATAGVQELTYDSFNNATNISYDSLGRILAKNFSSGQHSYTYDTDYFGTLTNVTFPNGSISYTYDDKLRVVEEVRIIDGIRFSKITDYDSADRAVRQAGNPGTVMAYIYGSHGLVDRIAGFINTTRHNAFGSVINRSYGSDKVTNFTYDRRSARLTRISTDTVQNLLFDYDAVGNIAMINDTANNRQQLMAYDYLDRLTSMSLNGGQSFAYSYDAVGNLLKTVRDSASATRLLYRDRPVHAPARTITGNANVDVHGITLLNNSNRSKIFEFRLINEKNSSTSTVNWTAHFGDDSLSNSTINFSLNASEGMVVLAEHEYLAGGSYDVNVTAGDPGSPSDFEKNSIKFGLHINSIEATSRNITNISYNFYIRNDLTSDVTGVSWQCNNGLSASGITVNSLSNKTVEGAYNYSSAGTKELNCSISSAEGNDSIKTLFEIDGIKIEAYNRTFSDGNTTVIRFNITNFFFPWAVDWKIASDGQTFTGTTQTIATGSSALVSQEINYTAAGQKSVDINITADRNLSDSFSDRFTLKAVEIEDYYFRNTTFRRKSFDFFAKNQWASNLSSNWNLTDPSAANTSFYLDTGEAVWVYVEADYATQGIKKPAVNAYSGPIVKSIVERFANKLVEILNYKTIVEDKSGSITEAFVRSNRDSHNFSWTFQTGTGTFTGNNATSINYFENVVLIIESKYPDSSVYNTSLSINSSSLNESAKGVIIT
ncbi:RHS repeat protein [Candidatus Woesearchaeota archaeon]|nr:RHS repeat protein [Candidatus Woesearchaeota archaeon]